MGFIQFVSDLPEFTHQLSAKIMFIALSHDVTKFLGVILYRRLVLNWINH